jgi:hypothetical protein
MSPFTSGGKLRAGTVLAASVGLFSLMTPFAPAAAQQKAAPPDFSSNQAGWVGFNGTGPFFEPAPGVLPAPVVSDPADPFVPNGTSKQPTFRIADLTNPNLKPWVKEHMKKDIDEVLAGKKSAFTAQSSSVPGGVPMFMSYGGPNPVIFLQTPKEVWLLFSGDGQVRRVYMDVPHSAIPKPSWYGESVGHYEGDTLVIDTIGLNDKTTADIYRTPHTEKMHVVERWRVVDGGEGMEAVFTVDDPDAFYQPWTGMRRYRRVQYDQIPESICAENNKVNLFDYHMPVADKPDF